MNKILSDDSDWEELLEFIAEKRLTPVIGKEMYKFRKEEDLVPIDQYLSKQILEQNRVTDQPPMTLNEAVNFLINDRRVKSMDIIRKLKAMVKDLNFDFEGLKNFLSITDLNYFINTAVYNNVLENNFEQIRGAQPNVINFSINEPFSDCDDLEKLDEPFVFNVFGSLLNTVDPALSEEDMLEYTGAFKEKMSVAPNLINALKNKNLLFLGCTFPDWMVRFILRLLSNEPMHDWGTKRTIIIVNDPTELRSRQYNYLKNYDVVTYEGRAVDFANLLAEKWRQQNPGEKKSKSVFLSYTVNDREALENLKAALENINNVNCWYDKREIASGDDFKLEIAKSIKSADLFIPLISNNSISHKDGYVQIEWFTANNVNTFRKIDGNNEKYLMPVVIDDTNPYDSNVPGYFSELSIGKVPQGIPDEDFLNMVKETLRL